MEQEINTPKPQELHFEKASWFKRWKLNNKALAKENERLMVEHTEWLQKMKELNETSDMIKKLARNQAKEIEDLVNRLGSAESKASSLEKELDILKGKNDSQKDDIRALGIIQVTAGDATENPTFSPLILTLDSGATQIKKKDVLPNTDFQYCLDQAKIQFMRLFDDKESN